MDPIGLRLRAIDWCQFSGLVENLLVEEGFQIDRLPRPTPDDGVDLLGQRAGQRVLIHLKHWKTWRIGSAQIQDLLAQRDSHQADRVLLVTLRGFTDEARQRAVLEGIELLEETGLSRRIEALPANPARGRIEAHLNDLSRRCPKCEGPMVESVSRHGVNGHERLWGCARYPHCDGLVRFEEEESRLGRPGEPGSTTRIIKLRMEAPMPGGMVPAVSPV